MGGMGSFFQSLWLSSELEGGPPADAERARVGEIARERDDGAHGRRHLSERERQVRFDDGDERVGFVDVRVLVELTHPKVQAGLERLRDVVRGADAYDELVDVPL